MKFNRQTAIWREVVACAAGPSHDDRAHREASTGLIFNAA